MLGTRRMSRISMICGRKEKLRWEELLNWTVEWLLQREFINLFACRQQKRNKVDSGRFVWRAATSNRCNWELNSSHLSQQRRDFERDTKKAELSHPKYEIWRFRRLGAFHLRDTATVANEDKLRERWHPVRAAFSPFIRTEIYPIPFRNLWFHVPSPLAQPKKPGFAFCNVALIFIHRFLFPLSFATILADDGKPQNVDSKRRQAESSFRWRQFFSIFYPLQRFRGTPASVLHVIVDTTTKIFNFISLDGMHGDINLIPHLAQAFFNPEDIFSFTTVFDTGEVDAKALQATFHIASREMKMRDLKADVMEKPEKMRKYIVTSEGIRRWHLQSLRSTITMRIPALLRMIFRQKYCFRVDVENRRLRGRLGGVVMVNRNVIQQFGEKTTRDREISTWAWRNYISRKMVGFQVTVKTIQTAHWQFWPNRASISSDTSTNPNAMLPIYLISEKLFRKTQKSLKLIGKRSVKWRRPKFLFFRAKPRLDGEIHHFQGWFHISRS